MRIGVWLGSYLNPLNGGEATYIDRLIKAIDDYQFDPLIDVCFITVGDISRDIKKNIVKLQYRPCALQTLLLWLFSFARINCFINGYIQKIIDERTLASFTKQLKDARIELVYYMLQSQCVLPNYPFISTNWDIGHLSTFAFPEVASQSEFVRRSSWYRDVLPRALFVFAESEAGKEELIKYTTINTSKIKVVPIFAGGCVKQIMPIEKQKAFLNSKKLTRHKYFFYPAQFWAHKNHIGLLNAFSIYLKEFPNYKLVFTGSDKGTLSYVLQIATQLNIQESVSYLGFVSTEEMNTLYQNATSLVMPSFMGPTNMPPLEAMELGCPVICSDIAGHREELGDAAIYFNPLDSTNMAKAMRDISMNRDLYLRRIKDQAGKTAFTIENAIKAIDKYFSEAMLIRRNWA